MARLGAALLLLMLTEARAGEAVVFDGTPLSFARASLYQSPYGNVTLDVDLSARRLACDGQPAYASDRGVALSFSIHPGPQNHFFAGTTIDIVGYLLRDGERDWADLQLTSTIRLAPFALKDRAPLSGRVTIPGHGGGSFTAELCPIRRVKLPLPLPDTAGELKATIDGKPWQPNKVLATRVLVDGRPTIANIVVVDQAQTCAYHTGKGSLALNAAGAVRHPGSAQPTNARLAPLANDVTYSALTSLAWLRLDTVEGEIRGSFAARQDAARGGRWEASGRFTAQLCPAMAP